MTLAIIQNAHIKVQKYPLNVKLCFVSSKIGNVIALYIKNSKFKNTHL